MYDEIIKAIINGEVTIEEMNELFEKRGIMVDYEDGMPVRIYHRQNLIWGKSNG